MMGVDWGFGWGNMWFGWLMMVGLGVAVILLIVWLVKLLTSGTSGANTNSPTAGPSRREAALDILQTRYARGEISKEEYLDMRSALGGGS